MSRDILRRAPASQEKIYIEICFKYLCTFLMIGHSIPYFGIKCFLISSDYTNALGLYHIYPVIFVALDTSIMSPLPAHTHPPPIRIYDL